MAFSLENYCSSFAQVSERWSHLPATSREFLGALDLPSIHPFCLEDEPFPPGIPPIGPLLVDDYHNSIFDKIITFSCQVFPALYAMGELWLRLFASAIAPAGIGYLMWQELNNRNPQNKATSSRWVSAVCVLSVAASVVLMTDTLYVLHFGPQYGGMMLGCTSVLSFRSCRCHGLRRTGGLLVALLLLTVYLVFGAGIGMTTTPHFGGMDVADNIHEGLYYNKENDLVKSITSHWPEASRTYSADLGATPWMPTGDSRTGIPFLLNFWHDPDWTRVWLSTTDNEVVALDVCFPPGGHNSEKPVILVFHGLNGGTKEEYVKDLTHRRTKEGYTVVVMIARGLMDLPVRGWNVFHGARVDDAHSAATALRRTLTPNQQLVGVGYSMGGIIISNYVARFGDDVKLDAAMSVSGGLDMRHMLTFERALRLWQPLLVEELRGTFIVGKFGEKYRARLTKKEMRLLMRGFHISDIDTQAVVTYNGFDDIIHYYSEMSAMGDIPLNSENNTDKVGRIGNVAIPFCVLHSLDDPLITWRTVAANEGNIMHPERLVQTGSGNLMMVLTKAGGHVGWPLGLFPSLEKWRWMSDAVGGFVTGVEKASQCQHRSQYV